jgi:hypothetical protein
MGWTWGIDGMYVAAFVVMFACLAFAIAKAGGL